MPISLNMTDSMIMSFQLKCEKPKFSFFEDLKKKKKDPRVSQISIKQENEVIKYLWDTIKFASAFQVSQDLRCFTVTTKFMAKLSNDLSSC